MGSYRQLTGMQKSPDRPDRVAPLPEHYEGTNVPYRGTQNHGVEIPKDAEYETREFEFKQDETKPVYLPDPDNDIAEPIPVRIVQGESKRERLDWRAVRFIVQDVPQQILGRHEKRRNVVIRVHDVKSDGTTENSDPIYLGNDSGLRPMLGFRIPAGAQFDSLRSTEDVWAVAEPGTQVEISIIYEFGVEL